MSLLALVVSLSRFDKLTVSGSTLVLSLSKDEPDLPLILRQAQDERVTQPSHSAA